MAATMADNNTENDENKTNSPSNATVTTMNEESSALSASAQLSKSLNAATDEAETENDGNKTAKPAGKTAKNKSKARHTLSGTDISLEPQLKKLKQRRINVAGAPKMPLNGYVRFMNDRREELRREQPQRTALEHTKMIGEEWQQLPDERKATYLEAAAKDRAVYHEELNKFLKEHPEILANELAKSKKSNNSGNQDGKNANAQKDNSSNNGTTKKQHIKSAENKRHRAATPDPDDIPLSQVKRTPTPPSVPAQARTFAAGEIPIYTNDFLEHNRNLEMELRTLRKTKTDLEQQNAVLEQHVENTKAGRAKVLGEVAELMEENKRLTAYNKALRQKLVSTLSDLSLPALQLDEPTLDNIDTYMQYLAELATSAQNDAILIKARDCLHKIDITELQKP